MLGKETEDANDPEPTREKIAAEYQDRPIEVEREVRELVGKCMWTSFQMKTMCRFGWPNCSPGFVARYRRFHCASIESSEKGRQVLLRLFGFYMGTFTIAQRADLSPVYEMIFRRLKERLFDWRYHVPELGLVDFGSDKPDGARSLQVEQMQTELKKIHQDAIEGAKHEPIPTIVLAYESVYRHFPHGWPPWEFQDRSK